METNKEETHLSPAETQATQEKIKNAPEVNELPYQVPRLPISNEDRAKFIECICSNQPYEEMFTRLDGKLTVTFRSRTARETEIIFAQLVKDTEEGRIKVPGDYINRLNLYNLRVQMKNLQGIDQIKVRIPAANEELTTYFREDMENSPIHEFPDPKMYLLLGLQNQFENKVTSLAREPLDPNFSKPAGII